MLKGIDISHWQAGLDIASTGAEFTIIKATQGTTFVDPSCDRHYQLAKKLGLKLGVYHYASGGDPIAEADIYSRFNTTLAGGKTAIYISHRLASTKFCDKIALFDKTGLIEYGTHDELMALPNSEYKVLYEMQFNKKVTVLPVTSYHI